MLVHWPKALHDGNGTAEVLIDEGAERGAAQRASGPSSRAAAGGPLFEILASIVTTLHGPHFVPIEWEFDKEARTAKLMRRRLRRDGERAAVDSGDGRARSASACRCPAASSTRRRRSRGTTVLRATGEIKFDWKGTHSSLAEIEHTDEALVA